MYFDELRLFGFVPPRDRASAKYLNDLQCNELLGRLCNIGLSRFKWNGLPDTCNERALEMQLFFFGKAVFFNDDTLGYCHTQVELPGPFNIYYESTVREAYSYNYRKRYTIDDSVLIRANKTMTPDYLICWVYAPKITNALRSIDVQLETLKRPYLIRCNDKERSSVRAALEKITDNEIAIIGTKFSQQADFEVLNLNASSSLGDMWATAKNYFNQCLNALGVDNNFSEKKERLVVSESVGEANSVRHSLESELEMREEACEQINKMFGLDVSVEANQLETFHDELFEINMGGANNAVSRDSVQELSSDS